MIRTQFLVFAFGILALIARADCAESPDSKVRFSVVGSPSRAAFNDNDTRLITWDTKGNVTRINVIDTTAGSTIKTLELEKGTTLWNVAIDPQGECLAVVSDIQGKSHLDLVSVKTTQRVFRESNFFDSTTGALRFSSDGRFLIASFRSGAAESSVGVWESTTGKSLWKAVYRVGSSGVPRTVRVSPNNRWVLATNENFHDDGPAIVWDLQNGQENCRVERNCAPGAAFSPDSKSVAIVDKKGLTRIIDLQLKTEISFTYRADRAVRDVAFSGNSQALGIVWFNDIDRAFEFSWYDLKTQKHNNAFTFTNASLIGPLETLIPAVCVTFRTSPKEIWHLEGGTSRFKAASYDQPLVLSPTGSLLLTSLNGKVSVLENPAK